MLKIDSGRAGHLRHAGLPSALLLLTATTTTFAQQQPENLLVNGAFESGLNGWTITGNATTTKEAWEGGTAVNLDPDTGATAEISQWVHGLKPTYRYTVAARIRTDDRIVPPILGVRNGAQIAKAHGWVAIDDEGKWLERRFEFHMDENSTSIEVYLQAWQTDLLAQVQFDDVRLWEGRQPQPTADPGDPAWPGAPEVATVPLPGQSLLGNPDFDDPSGGSWDLGINASVVEIDGQPAMQLVSSADTSRARQPVGAAFPPGGSWTISAEVKVDPGVVGSLYYSASGEFVSSTSFSNTDWARVEIPIESGDAWLSNGKLTLENYKNQPGAAWYRDVQFIASGEEWVATIQSPPARQDAVFFDDFSSGTLDPDRWLVSGKAWGGDNGGVAPDNVKLVEDFDNGEPIIALRLEAHGDEYDGPLEYNGRKTRVGAAVATRSYYASGRYEVRARVAPEYGTCTAFWPFHYIDHRMGEAEYWHEPNPRRNTEIDWEFPTDLAGADTGNFSFTKARTNSWGGQFGGEGGEHKGRKVLTDEFGVPLDLAQEALDGNYHTFTIEWRSGEDLGDEAITRTDVGSVRWFLDGRLVDELHDVPFGQGNVPYRAARFWLGTWFPAAGYAGDVGWTGNPNFDTTAAHIAWVRITPFDEERDQWVDETVPNLAWANPSEYPDQVEPIDPGIPGDLNGDDRVNGADIGLLLAAWNSSDVAADLDGSGVVDGADLGLLLVDWTG